MIPLKPPTFADAPIAGGAGRRFGQLDALRALSAACVVAHHSVQAYQDSVSDAVSGPAAWLDFGRLGVVVFFLISGFVIVKAIPEPTLAAAGDFWKHRFFRLYPPFWISVLVTLGTATLIGPSNCCAFISPVGPAMLLANLTMIPLRLHQNMMLGIYWTLEIELFFYLMITILHLARCAAYRPMIVIASVLLACAIVQAALESLKHGVQHIGRIASFTDTLHVSLLFAGAAIRLAWEAQPELRRRLAALPPSMKGYLLLLAGFFVSVVLRKAGQPIGPHTFRAAFTYLGAMGLFLGGLRLFRPTRIGTFLGDRSYGVYLLHLPMFSLLSYWMSLGHRLSFAAYGLLAMAATLACADLMRRFVERPAIAWAHRRKAFRAAAAAAAL